MALRKKLLKNALKKLINTNVLEFGYSSLTTILPNITGIQNLLLSRTTEPKTIKFQGVFHIIINLTPRQFHVKL